MSSDKKDQRSLSSKKRGYLLAILGGTLGLSIGMVVSPLVLFGLNRTMKEKDGKKPNVFKRWALIGIVGAPLCFSVSGFLDDQDFQRKVERCNDGRDERCETLLEKYSSKLKASKSDREKVTNPIAIPVIEKMAADNKVALEKQEKEKAAKKVAKAKEKREREAAERKARYPRISVSEKVGCEMYIQQALKDPRSYRENNSVSQILETGLIDFSAKNSFGGAVRRVFDCNSFTFRD